MKKIFGFIVFVAIVMGGVYAYIRRDDIKDFFNKAEHSELWEYQGALLTEEEIEDFLSLEDLFYEVDESAFDTIIHIDLDKFFYGDEDKYDRRIMLKNTITTETKNDETILIFEGYFGSDQKEKRKAKLIDISNKENPTKDFDTLYIIFENGKVFKRK